jgi:hypothetical protein
MEINQIEECVEARVGIEPTYKGFADLSLTTWVPRLFKDLQVTDCVLLSCYCTKQKGERIETRTAFFLRYYVSTTDENGAPVRKQKCVKLADKSDLYRSWTDVERMLSPWLSMS